MNFEVKNIKQLTCICIIFIVITSCDNQKKETTKKADVKKEVNEAIETIKAYTIEEKDLFLRQFEAKRDHTKTQITALKKKLVNIKDTRKKALEEKVTDLEYKQEKFEEKIVELKGSSEAAYHNIILGMDSAINELDYALEEANKEFNN